MNNNLIVKDVNFQGTQLKSAQNTKTKTYHKL